MEVQGDSAGYQGDGSNQGTDSQTPKLCLQQGHHGWAVLWGLLNPQTPEMGGYKLTG